MGQKRMSAKRRKVGKGAGKKIYLKGKKKIKLKTRRGAHKRFSMTATGKIKRKRAKLRHILTSKAQKQKRRLRSAGFVSPADMPKVARLLPYE